MKKPLGIYTLLYKKFPSHSWIVRRVPESVVCRCRKCGQLIQISDRFLDVFSSILPHHISNMMRLIGKILPCNKYQLLNLVMNS